MKNSIVNTKRAFFESKTYFLKIRNLLLICGCIFALAGCTGQESNNVTGEQKNNKVAGTQQNNKFIGVWSCYGENGKHLFCCISSSGIGYVGNVQSGTHEMDVEEKTTYEYKIEGDTIYLENERFKRSFQLQEDYLIGDDGNKYSRSRKGLTIYRESEDDDSPHEIVEIVKGTEEE